MSFDQSHSSCPHQPQPAWQLKQPDLPSDEQDGVIYLFGRRASRLYYTRLDQALILWAIAVAIIFLTARFHAFDWHQQAKVWSALSLSVLVASSLRAWPWALAKQLRWVVYCWIGITLLGLGLTDYGIYRSVIPILLNLSPLWLGLSALGYGITAWGMGSRALGGIALVHLGAIALLWLWPSYAFLITGAVISGCLFALAQFQWDHC
ncbi:MAG: hypothetical protein HC824_20560 [Synechococcales cyanobacterium RM1_1_8]|nr:hypothetical protein [Synechococcales cyanobacterium RM1_1_8]